MDHHKLIKALQLGLRASLSACEHPGDFHHRGAKRGCGACRAVIAIREILEDLKGDAMLIKITVEKGVVMDVETSEPALVQIVVADREETSTFETVAQALEFEPEGHEADALLNHEVMADPLNALFVNDGR